MVVLAYDGSWVGLLTLVFEAFEHKWQVSAIYRQVGTVQNSLFGHTVQIVSQEHKAIRVWKGLGKVISARALRQLYCVYLSEIPQIEVELLRAVRFYFSGAEAPEYAYGHQSVLKLSQTAKMVDRERHRMKAFVRFQRMKDDLYVAVVEPDFNVLPLISGHFESRYADQAWLIYDLKRQYGLYYNREEVMEVQLSAENASSSRSLWHEEEIAFMDLWQRYFNHVNIGERKNSKLHLRELPRRYWKHLVEKRLW